MVSRCEENVFFDLECISLANGVEVTNVHKVEERKKTQN